MSDQLFIRSVKTRLMGNRCPHCGKAADGGTAVDIGQPASHKPKPGDFAVCMYCLALNTYDDQLNLRATSDQERDEIQRDPRLHGVLQIVKETAAALKNEREKSQ